MSEPFDFEAFISGAQLARTTVSAFKVDHTTEIKRLKDRHDELRERFDVSESGELVVGDAREGVVDPAVAELRDIEDRVDALRREMEASRVEFVIRTLTPDEFGSLGEDSVYEQFALQSVTPKLTAEQAKRVADVVGASQWGHMMMEANSLVVSKAAVPDFSPSSSAHRSTRES